MGDKRTIGEISGNKKVILFKYFDAYYLFLNILLLNSIWKQKFLKTPNTKK